MPRPGKPLTIEPGPNRDHILSRFYDYMAAEGPGSCWEWLGALNLGYGTMWIPVVKNTGAAGMQAVRERLHARVSTSPSRQGTRRDRAAQADPPDSGRKRIGTGLADPPCRPRAGRRLCLR